MFKAQSWEERNRTGVTPAVFKSEIFKNGRYRLFVESDAEQAIQINQLSGKPVLCVENNKLYGDAE